MRKFIVFMLSVLVIFAMCSCQPTENMDGNVEFKVYTDTQVSKALTATDPGKDAVKSIVIKFTPINQSNPVGASTEFEFGLIKWDDTNVNAITNGTWDDTKHRFLSQGQWKIEAIATTKTTGTVAESDEETLYYGFANVYISKVKNSASVKMTPMAKTSGTGTLMIGYDENGTALPISSKAVVSADPTKQRLTYTIYDITGVQKATGTLDGTTFTDGSDGVDAKIKYADATVSTLTQGSYIVAMVIDQKNGDSWITSTGGSAVDVAVYKGLNTFVWGEVSPSDYIHTSISTSMDIDGGINLTVIPSVDKKSFTASVTYEVGSDLTVDKYLWFVDGKLDATTTSAFAPTFDTTNEQNGTGIKYGEHIIQCVAVDTSKKVKSEMSVKKIKYDFSQTKWVEF